MYERLKVVEKWIIRLVIIQFVILVIAQVMMAHRNFTPYLNKAVRYEGVIQPVKDMLTESVEQQARLWYHN